jgi:hypothetical protein
VSLIAFIDAYELDGAGNGTSRSLDKFEKFHQDVYKFELMEQNR